jgi:hypothetical protein
MLENIQMSMLCRILQLVKIIFLEKVMAVLVNKCQVVRAQRGRPIFGKIQI